MAPGTRYPRALLATVVVASVVVAMWLSHHTRTQVMLPADDKTSNAPATQRIDEPQRVTHIDEPSGSAYQDDLHAPPVGPPSPALVGTPNAEYLLLLAWRPILLTAQVLHLRSIGWRGHIVFVCPDEEDAAVATRLFVHNSSAYGSAEVFLHRVEARVALTNGRYFLLAAHRFLVRLRGRLGTTRDRVLAVAVDTSRTLWCHDLFDAMRAPHEFNLTIVLSSFKRGSYLWKRAVHADIYMRLPTFALDAPTNAMTRVSGATTRMVVMSHIVGGELGLLTAFLSAVEQSIENVLPGLAIEPVLGRVAPRFMSSGFALIDHWAPDLSSLCQGSGAEAQVGGVCMLGSTKARGVPVVNLAILNFWSCGPVNPNVTRTSGFVLPAEGHSRRNCRGILPHGSVKLVHPLPERRQAVVDATNATLLDKWRTFEYQQRVPSKECHAKDMVDLILGVAIGYTPEKVVLYVRSFLMHRRGGKSKLVLFVRSDHVRLMRTAYPDDDVIVVDAAPYFETSPLKKCPIMLARMDVMRSFLARQTVPALRCIKHVLMVDTRDAVFQADPFSSLDALRTGAHAAGEWPDVSDFLLVPMERWLLGEEDFFFNIPYRFNRYWVVSAFGASFFHTLMKEPITGNASSSNGVTFPILCGGLYMGTAAAIMDFFDVFVASAVALGGCSVNDQGLLIGLVAAGLGESRYPHPVVVSDPLVTPFTNGPRGGGEVVWDANGRVVNCDGVPYAVMHQYTHFSQFSEYFTRQLS